MSGLLDEWTVQAGLPSHFEEQVWRRIEREESQPNTSQGLSTALRRWIASRLPRPALAFAYCGILLVAGAGIGWTQARHANSQVTSQLSQRYVNSVDPFQPQP